MKKASVMTDDGIEIIGTRIELEQATTAWAPAISSRSEIKLYLNDELDIQVANGFNGGLKRLHDTLRAHDCSFIYRKHAIRGKTTHVHTYQLRVRLETDCGRQWYMLQLRYTPACEYPELKFFEIDGSRKGRKLSIPVNPRTTEFGRLLVIGERLCWSLTSQSGLRCCMQFEHSPLQLYDVFRSRVRSFRPKAKPSQILTP